MWQCDLFMFWVLVKLLLNHVCSPHSRGDSGNQSSTSSNPTLSSNGDMYSNLGDLFVEGAFVRESQRRHSFAEGDELIAIHRTGTR